MKYQEPKIYSMNESFSAYAVCVSGGKATHPSSCLSGVSAANSSCSQGVHPALSCKSGTLPGNVCASGTGDSEW